MPLKRLGAGPGRARPREVVPVSYGALLTSVLRAARSGHDLRAQLRHGIRSQTGAPHAFLLSSAREGLRWLLSRVATRRPGGEVIVPNYNFFAVAQAVTLAGLKPVFVDAALPLEEPSFEEVKRSIGPKTAAILMSHHFGRPSDMPRWQALAKAHDLELIEDCAHAYGARIAGRSVGLFGLGGVFSLSLTKGLVGGAGGVVITADDEVARDLAERESKLREPSSLQAATTLLSAVAGKALLDPEAYGSLVHKPNLALQKLGVDAIDRLMTEQPTAPSPNARPEALHPAYAAVALSHLPDTVPAIGHQRRVARAIIEARTWRHLSLPFFETDRFATHLTLPVRTPHRAALRKKLLEAGFDTRTDYLQATTSDRTRFPVSTRLQEQGLYLPHRALTRDEDIERLVSVLAAFDDAHEPIERPARPEPAVVETPTPAKRTLLPIVNAG